MSLPVLIIANPISGAGRGARLATRLATALGELGIATETRMTTLERNGRDLAAEVEAETFAAIAVVGGDGSINDVVRGLRASTTPIAQLPAGTANVWAREARIPRRPEAVARMIAAGRTIEASLGVANGEAFFLFVGAGYDARLVHRVEVVRKRSGHTGGMVRWLLPAWSEFLRPPADLCVTVGGERLEGMFEVLVTRVRSYAAFMSMPAGIDIEDGALHVLAFARTGKLGMIGRAWRAMWGTLRPGRDVIHIETKSPVRIESAAAGDPFHRDGDHAGQLPLEIELSPRTVRLLLP